ncbi:hypothetical protein [Azospirillum argentinense]
MSGKRPKSALLHRATLSLLLLSVLATGAAWAKGPLDRTEPGHMPPVPPGGYDLPLSPPVVQFPLPPQWVTIRSTQDWRHAGTFEKELSKSCASRQFREQMPMRYRAIFKGEVLGVAFGHGLNLHDPKQQANRKLIYLFRNGDSTGCTIVSITNEDLRVLNDAQAGGAPKR